MTELSGYTAFEVEARGLGFQTVLERRWNAGDVVHDHGHPFDVRAIVAEGEMWLTVGGSTAHLTPGQRFELARDVAHSERYGDAGAVLWVARRS